MKGKPRKQEMIKENMIAKAKSAEENECKN